ncbi:hypothetical protein BHM03_00055885 [Ensete ventricosum]|nr:hypothetical protein BHM03_00055885 [Ensete ventricosum]
MVFTKKSDGHKLCTKSSFDRFFKHPLGNSNYWPFLNYLPMGSRTSTVLQKNVTVINFAYCHARNCVLIGFLFTISEIKNSGHSQCFSP